MLSLGIDLSMLLNASGAGLGVFWTYSLLTRKNTFPGQYFLSALILLLVVYMVNTIFQLSAYKAYLQVYQDIANGLCFILGPLLLGYIFSHTRKDLSWLHRYWLHFLPCAICLPLILLNSSYSYFPLFNKLFIYIWNAQMLIYLLWGYQALKQENRPASLPGLLLRSIAVIWVLNFALFLLKTYWFYIPDVIHLNVTLLFYMLILTTAIRILKTEQNDSTPAKTFSLSNNHYQVYAEKLQTLMTEEQLFQNPELNIQQLAQMADISPRYVSATLNHQLNQSFYEFVNSYRIKAVLDKLKDPESDTLTLFGIACQFGFKSNSAFYKAFRQHTGITPGAYRKLRNKPANALSQ